MNKAFAWVFFLSVMCTQLVKAAANASTDGSSGRRNDSSELGFLRLVADSAESAFVVRNAARLSASDLLSLTSEAQRASTAAPDPLEETGFALRTGDVVQTRAGAGNTALVWQSARHSAPMCRIILGGSSEMQLGPAIRGRPELRLNSGTALVDCTADGRDFAAAGNGESSTPGKIGNEAIMLSGLGGTLVMWHGSQAAFRYIYEGGEVPLLAAFSGSSVLFQRAQVKAHSAQLAITITPVASLFPLALCSAPRAAMTGPFRKLCRSLECF